MSNGETLDGRAMLALADACERASGPDQELDEAIMAVLYRREERYIGTHLEYSNECVLDWVWVNPATDKWVCTHASRFTRSLDDAMTLLDQYGVLLHLSDIGADGLPLARIGRPDLLDAPIFNGISSGIAKDATPLSGLCLALCAAALRARASQTPETGS